VPINLDASGKSPEESDLPGRPLARFLIYGQQNADRAVVRRPQRHPDARAYRSVTQRWNMGDQRVPPPVDHHQGAIGCHDVPSEGVREKQRDGYGQARTAREESPLGIDQRQTHSRNVQEFAGKSSGAVQQRLTRRRDGVETAPPLG
jgi:hypothetical protein